MTALRDLDAELIQFAGAGRMHTTIDLATAQGVMFLCPQCFARNGGEVGTHSVICWFRDRGVSAEASPGPGRWSVSGNSLDDLTLAPSVHLSGPGCGWHGWVRNGDAC